MHSVFRIILIALIVSLASAVHCASFKVVAVPTTNVSMLIDGRLTETAWRKAGRIASFEHYMRTGEISNQTEVLLLYDRSALYVAYKCRERNMTAIKAAVTGHDANVWDDDAADFFLDPKADRASFYQFIVNTVGARYDGLGSDPYGFNPGWDAKAQISASGWTVEIRIPFSELGVECPEAGDHWLGNFCRQEQPSKELSCWNPTMGSFDAPGAFGEIVFGSLEDKARRDSQAAVAPRTRREGDPDYLVWETSPWRRYSAREDASSVGPIKRLDVMALAGQTESRALMVTNLTDETLSARLLVEGMLEGTVETLLPTFVRTADGRPYADALVPPDPIGQVTVPAGETRQIWLNFHGEKAGKYEGTLTISPLTASKRDMQIKLSVGVVSPPKTLEKPIAFTWDYLGDAEKRGLVEQYMETMLDHGITAFWVMGLRYMPRPAADDEGNLLEPTDWSKFRDQVSLKWKPGRKLYITMDVWEKADERRIYNGKFDSPGWRIAFKKIVTEMADVLRDMGLSYDDYLVNPVDESIDARYLAIARLVKEVDPKIEIIADTIGSSLAEVRSADVVTDHWVPHFNAFRADATKESIAYLKSTGKPLGFYFYSEGSNEKAQDPYGHYLWRLWYAYSEGLDGLFGYWTATQHYGDPWNRHQVQASYDPSLFYPGNGCVITGRRWEAWRRGLEDIALLKLCESAGVDKSVITRAVESVMKAPMDPNVADRARLTLITSLQGR